MELLAQCSSGISAIFAGLLIALFINNQEKIDRIIFELTKYFNDIQISYRHIGCNLQRHVEQSRNYTLNILYDLWAKKKYTSQKLLQAFNVMEKSVFVNHTEISDKFNEMTSNKKNPYSKVKFDIRKILQNEKEYINNFIQIEIKKTCIEEIKDNLNITYMRKKQFRNFAIFNIIFFIFFVISPIFITSTRIHQNMAFILDLQNIVLIIYLFLLFFAYSVLLFISINNKKKGEKISELKKDIDEYLETQQSNLSQFHKNYDLNSL